MHTTLHASSWRAPSKEGYGATPVSSKRLRGDVQQLRIHRSLKTPLRSLPVYITTRPISLSCIFSAADPGFSVGGGRQPSKKRAPTYDFAKFSEKLHDIEKILDRRGDAGSAPHRSATDSFALKSPFVLFKADISITFAVRFPFIRCESTFIRITWVVIYFSGCTSHVCGMFGSLVGRERRIYVTCVT